MNGCFVWVPSVPVVSSDNLKPVKPGPFGNDDRCNPENYDDVGRWYTHKDFGTWAPGITSFEEWDIWLQENPGKAEAAALDACNKPPEAHHDPNAYRGNDELSCPRGMHFVFNDGDYNGGRCVPNKKNKKKPKKRSHKKKTKRNDYSCGC